MYKFEQVPTTNEFEHRVLVEFEADHIDDVLENLKYFLLAVGFSPETIKERLDI